jgi:hypothetical protein
MSRYSIALILLLVIIITDHLVKKTGYVGLTDKAAFIQCTIISDIDGSEYKVVDGYENKNEAANILAKINFMYVTLIKHLKRNRMNTIWADNILYLADNYNPDVLQEHIPTDISLTSYVHNKGEKIIMCLRQVKDKNVFYGMNTIKFVAIHELAHMMTQSFGHENDFWLAFKFILGEAGDLRMLEIIDYSKASEPYCGITITSSPLYDV